MKRKNERRAAKLLIDQCFSAVANLPFVQGKWICIKIWYQLILQNVNEDFNVQINEGYFKRVLIESGKVSTNLSVESENGFYYRSAKCKKGGKSQTFHAILVTEPGSLPQLSPLTFWINNIIIDLPPSWCTRASKRRKLSQTTQASSQASTQASIQASSQVSTHATRPHAISPVPPPPINYHHRVLLGSSKEPLPHF